MIQVVDPIVFDLIFSQFSEFTLNLTDIAKLSKMQIDLEFWQWV